MGSHEIQPLHRSEDLRVFMRCLLADLRALEQMLESGMIEAGVRRIGAEQELVFVDDHARPAPVALEVLEDLDDPCFTTELARFNLEFNLDPMSFGGLCLSELEGQLDARLDEARAAAARHGAEPILAGILPTLQKSDLTLDNMTPKPRYKALNDTLTRLRGSAYEFRFTGTDELIIKHDSVMLESCNTSFQVHFQVSAEEFPRFYNAAQAVAGPTLAAAVNSPLLFGRRLWKETRIALFQQALDTRAAGLQLQERRPRVSFGSSWVRRCVTEIFQEDIARFRVLLGRAVDEDPLAVLADGRIPPLTALQLHNGTVYRWTRPCYGITDGKPHLRIENRILPSPTPPSGSGSSTACSSRRAT